MDDRFIIAAYGIIADTMPELGPQNHGLAIVSDEEALTVAALAAKYFQNRQDRALCVTVRAGYRSRSSVSRYNRRLHALSTWLGGLLGLVSSLLKARGSLATAYLCL